MSPRSWMRCTKSRPDTIARLPDYRVIVALGANLPSPVGDPECTLNRVIEELSDWSSAGFQRSALVRSAPQDCPPGSPDFLNAVVLFDVPHSEDPWSVLHRLQGLEARFGRPAERATNAPRSLDLDLICFGERHISSGALMLPHPRATQRRFVLEPLAQLVPQLQFPGYSQTVRELLQTLPE